LHVALLVKNKGDTPVQFVAHSTSNATEFRVKGKERATTFSRIRGNVFAVAKSTTLIEFQTYLSLFTPTVVDFIVYEANSLAGSFYRIFHSQRTITDVGQKLFSSGMIGVRLKAGYYYYLATAMNKAERFYITKSTVPIRTLFGALHFGLEFSGYPAPLLLPTITPANYVFYQSVVTGEFSFVPHITPQTGIINPHDSIEIFLTTPPLTKGNYRSVVTLSSLDPQQSLVTLPLEVKVLSSTAANPDELPVALKVEQNYPNPFNPQTTLRYAINNESLIRLSVFNVLGQKVDERLIGVQPAGTYELPWNSEGFASGVYFYTLTAVSVKEPYHVSRETRKMQVMK
jgi:hypothetical protein